MYFYLLVRSIFIVFGQVLPLILQICMFISMFIILYLSSCSQPTFTLIPKIIFREPKKFYLVTHITVINADLLHVYSGYPKISALVHSSHNHFVQYMDEKHLNDIFNTSTRGHKRDAYIFRYSCILCILSVNYNQTLNVHI